MKINASPGSLKPQSSRKRGQHPCPKVTLYTKRSSLDIPFSLIEKAVVAVLDNFNVSTDEVVIHLVSKRKIASLHKKFFNDPSSTDCISFPIDSPYEKKKGYCILGEIFICPEVALDYAKKQATEPQEEVLLYLVHGLLHLLGYDDLTEPDRALMRQKEAECLKKIRLLS